jgi:hypothetical protein
VPSIHIGSVEVRILPAPAAAAPMVAPMMKMRTASPAEAPALSRGYAAGFGLSQS